MTTKVFSGRITEGDESWLASKYGSNKSHTLRRLVALAKGAEDASHSSDLLVQLEAVADLMAKSEDSEGRYPQDVAFEIIQKLNAIALLVGERAILIGSSNITRR